MKHYPQDLRDAMVSKMCMPGGPSAPRLSQETGIPIATLYSWKRKLGGTPLAKDKRSQDWTPEEIIEILFESKGLSEEKLGRYLRDKGLHSHDLEEWKSSLSPKQKGRPKLDPEIVELRAEKKKLEREVRRKDKALAEASALLILKKKAEAIWGISEEEDEQD